jgi:phosphate transport system protein
MRNDRWRRRRGQDPGIGSPSESPSVNDRSYELDEIDEQIARLFDLVTQGLIGATAAFLAADVVAGRRIASADLVIDELHRGTEALVQRQLLSATGGIDADGLARLVLALRIMPELERSGDLVEHIAARASAVLLMQLTDHARSLIRQMGAVAEELWRRTADSFTGGDSPTIAELRHLDDGLDDLHVQLCAELAEADLSVAAAIEMGLVGRFFERLGDHAVNVARRVDTEVQNPFALAGPA